MAKAFDVDLRETKRFEDDLKEFAEKSFPYASRNTLNVTAFRARKKAIEILPKKMVIRQKFILKSVLVQKSKSLNVRDQEAIVGSTFKGFESQEFGDNIRSRGKIGHNIPTQFASREAKGSVKRRSPVKRYSMRSIKIKRRPRISGKVSKKQELIIKARYAAAAAKANKFFYHDNGRKKGIFTVIGRARKSTKRGVFSGKLKMVHDLSEKNIRVKKRPWLAPSVEYAQNQMPQEYNIQLKEQLKRNRLFKP